MSTGVHRLITGINGQGKTLYTVAEILQPMVGAELSYETASGAVATVKRRLVVGGIKDLLLPHELMDVPKIDPEVWKDEDRDTVREPGDAPHAVVCRLTNWWLWCMPGDLIVVDECQRCFRPMASGRRVPMFIEKLETARHYGVQFVYITQHPQLLHMNLRALVGPHSHVQRVFGGASTMVYTWPTVSAIDRYKNATKRVWKHPKEAFGLYKSAEVHTKFKQPMPLAVYGILAVVIAGVVYIGWSRPRWLGGPGEAASLASAAKPASAPQNAPGGPNASPAGGKPGAPRWPAYEPVAIKMDREPLEGRAVQYEGGYTVGRKVVGYFGVIVDGERVATMTLDQMVRMGYTFTESGPCVGVLRYGQFERLVACGKRVAPASGQAEGRQMQEPAGLKPDA